MKMSMAEAGRLGGLKNQQLRLKKYEESPNFCSFCKGKLL